MTQPVALIIEDEQQVANVTRYMLRRSGFKACTACSAAEGMAMALENVPDVVICDIALPDASGLDILQRLKTNAATAHIPIILMSGSAGFDCAGMFTFLAKPFDPASLISATRSALASVRTAPSGR
jgi:CheY-like chemotaxis protein